MNRNLLAGSKSRTRQSIQAISGYCTARKRKRNTWCLYSNPESYLAIILWTISYKAVQAMHELAPSPFDFIVGRSLCATQLKCFFCADRSLVIARKPVSRIFHEGGRGGGRRERGGGGYIPQEPGPK